MFSIVVFIKSMNTVVAVGKYNNIYGLMEVQWEITSP